MGFKSRDLTVKLAGPGGGDCGGCTPTRPDCGGCTPTKPDCGACSPTRDDDLCTRTITGDETPEKPKSCSEISGVALSLLRRQLQETLAGAAR